MKENQFKANCVVVVNKRSQTICTSIEVSIYKSENGLRTPLAPCCVRIRGLIFVNTYVRIDRDSKCGKW